MSSRENVLQKYPDLLTVKHLTEIFGVSKNTIYKSIHEGKFGVPIKCIGRELKVPKIYIEDKYFRNHHSKCS